MRAILSSRYGSPDALELREVEQPTPDPDRVLVRMHAASLNAMDKHMLRGTPRVMRPMMGGLRRPKDPRRGGDIAGVVEAVGADVTTVAVGDEVFGGCAGAFADYATPLAKNLVSKPANLTFDEAAAIPVAGVTALQALRDKGGLQPGQTVLINGAGGGVGTYLVQIAKALGAGEVTAVCGPGSVELARASGADRVVDYTQEDFTKAGGPYDLIVDNAGTRPFARCASSSRPTERASPSAPSSSGSIGSPCRGSTTSSCRSRSGCCSRASTATISRCSPVSPSRASSGRRSNGRIRCRRRPRRTAT